MSKLIFFAAFCYFCYYAGNKAYPPATTPLATQTKTIITADSMKVPPIHLMEGLPNAQPGAPGHLPGPGIKTGTSEAITGSHMLIIAMPASIAGNINPAQDSIIRLGATRSLALLNEVNK